ncbi:hypothetical protein HBH1_00060 [Herbaspirillum sp. BH-1]|jgi:hypothetical protein|uniref:DUF3649 domain-containing protein n=1 Tax=Herbaspirillum frisingense TaxID=92645 RepID=A0ABU1PKX5_9BURK|nr:MULTISPECIES: DUF3649 domain-containing protein [Herbaspirillum]MDR6586003.1 hypothetical protein [Herbaspirillum frisingense]PLY61088.1 hypothetical protein HBH1_00060 [Herbaspirillum sp. BH-1]
MKTTGSRSGRELLLRLLVAALGGYAWAALAAVTLSWGLPWCCGWSRAQGVLTGSLSSVVFYLLAVVWAFSTHRLHLALLISALLWGVMLGWVN